MNFIFYICNIDNKSDIDSMENIDDMRDDDAHHGESEETFMLFNIIRHIHHIYRNKIIFMI